MCCQSNPVVLSAKELQVHDLWLFLRQARGERVESVESFGMINIMTMTCICDGFVLALLLH